MNLECEETASSIVYKNNPRVSVIRWIGREPTKLCQDEPSFDEDCTSSFVEEELFGSRIVSNSSTNTFKYCCSLCEKTFKCLSHWKSHERTHTGQILFECETCGKSFTRPDDLQCHRFTHLNRNPLSTSGEIISYVQKNVEKHISRPNTSSGLISTVTSELVGTVGNTKLFNCDRCSRKFFSTAGLVEHIQFHKGKSDTSWNVKFTPYIHCILCKSSLFRLNEFSVYVSVLRVCNDLQFVFFFANIYCCKRKDKSV